MDAMDKDGESPNLAAIVRQRSPPRRSLLLALIGDEEEFRFAVGFELLGPARKAKVVTDAQGVAVEFVDGADRLVLIGALGAGDVELLRLGRRVDFDGPLVDDLADGHRIGI